MPDSDIETRLKNAAVTEQLESHLSFLRTLLRQAVQVSPAAGTNSLLGGRPLVPKDFEWPAHSRGLHTAVAQIDCAELPPTSRLPSVGFLTFLAAHDPDGDSWFWTEDFMRIHYWTDPSDLQDVSVERTELPPRPVSFDLRFSLPFNRYLRKDWPWNEQEHEAFEYGVADELGDAVVDDNGNFLLGYAPAGRIADDPSPGEGWELLLLLRTDEDQGMIWGDDSALMVFIETDALTRRDFSNPQCVIG